MQPQEQSYGNTKLEMMCILLLRLLKARCSQDQLTFTFIASMRTREQLVWKYNTGGWPFNPAVAYGKVFAGSGVTFFALDANTGAVIWEYTAPSVISDSPVVADGKVIFADGGSPNGWGGHGFIV